MTRASVDDAGLVRECLGGDLEAFDRLVERHQKVIFNVAFRMVNDYEDARDISQTVFLKAYEKLASYDSSYSFHSWVYRIAINESLNFCRKSHRAESTDPLDSESFTDPSTPEDAARRSELGRSLRQALMSIRPEYRAVIVLKHYMGWSYRDIGESLSIDEKTVKSRLYTARQQLKEIMLERGLESCA